MYVCTVVVVFLLLSNHMLGYFPYRNSRSFFQPTLLRSMIFLSCMHIAHIRIAYILNMVMHMHKQIIKCHVKKSIYYVPFLLYCNLYLREFIDFIFYVWTSCSPSINEYYLWRKKIRFFSSFTKIIANVCVANISKIKKIYK